jgi:hypothetical protein
MKVVWAFQIWNMGILVFLVNGCGGWKNEDALWQQLLGAKYLKKVTLTQCKHKPTKSHFWSGLMSVKYLFYS